jgi:hypothetical protein
MNATVSVSADGRYGIAVVETDFGGAGAAELSRRVIAFAMERSLPCCLIDVRKARFLGSAFDHYDFANHDLADIKDADRLPVAVLVAEGDNSHEFLETVAVNAGYELRVFAQEGAALAWIEERIQRASAIASASSRRLKQLSAK